MDRSEGDEELVLARIDAAHTHPSLSSLLFEHPYIERAGPYSLIRPPNSVTGSNPTRERILNSIQPRDSQSQDLHHPKVH